MVTGVEAGMTVPDEMPVSVAAGAGAHPANPDTATSTTSTNPAAARYFIGFLFTIFLSPSLIFTDLSSPTLLIIPHL